MRGEKLIVDLWLSLVIHWLGTIHASKPAVLVGFDAPSPLLMEIRSAVGLGHQRSSLVVSQHWCDIPIQAFSPFGGMFVTSVCCIGFNQDPPLDWARSVKSLPRLALRKRSPSGQELLSCNFVVTSLKRPVHQKGHASWCVPQRMTASCVFVRYWSNNYLGGCCVRSRQCEDKLLTHLIQREKSHQVRLTLLVFVPLEWGQSPWATLQKNLK